MELLITNVVTALVAATAGFALGRLSKRLDRRIEEKSATPDWSLTFSTAFTYVITNSGAFASNVRLGIDGGIVRSYDPQDFPKDHSAHFIALHRGNGILTITWSSSNGDQTAKTAIPPKTA